MASPGIPHPQIAVRPPPVVRTPSWLQRPEVLASATPHPLQPRVDPAGTPVGPAAPLLHRRPSTRPTPRRSSTNSPSHCTARSDCEPVRTALVDTAPGVRLRTPPPDPQGPMRDLAGGKPTPGRPTTDFETSPHLALLSTSHDRPVDWLRTGQAVERVLLRATLAGLSTSFVTQTLEWHDLRWPLRDPTWPMCRWCRGSGTALRAGGAPGGRSTTCWTSNRGSLASWRNRPQAARTAPSRPTPRKWHSTSTTPSTARVRRAATGIRAVSRSCPLSVTTPSSTRT